jgi:uncharacterized protein YebE (UPF0316 family)
VSQQPKIELSIYIDNQAYGMRIWPAVPRVGDEIMVCRMEPRTDEHSIFNRPKVIDEHAIAIVETACWGTSDRSRESPWSELRVSLFCKWRNP